MPSKDLWIFVSRKVTVYSNIINVILHWETIWTGGIDHLSIFFYLYLADVLDVHVFICVRDGEQNSL